MVEEDALLGVGIVKATIRLYRDRVGRLNDGGANDTTDRSLRIVVQDVGVEGEAVVL